MSHTFRGGKLPAQPARRQLRLSATLAALPAPPASVDFESEVDEWPMFLNDTLGCCVPAGMGHAVEQMTQYGSGEAVEVTDDDVLKAYEAISGYKPGKPRTDVGCLMQDAMAFWRKTGIGGHRIAAYASLDVSNLTEVKQAIALFGSVNIGFNFPDTAMEQFDEGEVWDVVKGAQIEGGHCVLIGGYGEGLFDVVTWGATTQMTEAFWHKYVDEAWVVLDADGLDNAGIYFAGNVDYYTLGQEFAALTGEENPIPVPDDPTPVGPAPVDDDADSVFASAARDWLDAKGL